MNYNALREELKQYYWVEADDRSDAFYEKCVAVLDDSDYKSMSVYQMKTYQYRTIADMFDPVLFDNSPFYYETGTMAATCDGSRYWSKMATSASSVKGHRHPGGWTYWKNEHKFREQDLEIWNISQAQKKEQFYLICGPYNDTMQHFAPNYRPFLEKGLKGIYLDAEKQLTTANAIEEKEFLLSVMEGMLQLKKMAEKFAAKAESKSAAASDEAIKSNYKHIAETAKHVPWEKPETFYEALNFYAFFRKALGTLEGIGPNTFGRIDMDLYPFYRSDIEKGILTPNEAYELICKFLIGFDMVYDHNKIMAGYADHELENTYVLGGCDEDGKPLYNELTKMFLQATRDEKIIFPKIKCRYFKNSPKEYLDEIDRSVVDSRSTVIFQNDDAVIPALVRAGRPLEEARDYLVSGCWGMLTNGSEKADGGNYVNLLKVFEYTIHNLTDRMENVGMRFNPVDDAQSFEEVYKIVCDNILILFKERLRITQKGGNMWDQVDVLPIFSSTLESCIDKKKDYTAGGCKYRDDHFDCVGLPNIVDSLLAIKQLCFDSKKYAFGDFLAAIRNNWENAEYMRADAINCNGWGDGSTESCTLAARFNNDLFNMLQDLTGTYGGKVLLGHLTYTEIRWWGAKTLATPDGRRNGDYITQGLTPSRLKKIPSVTSVVNSMGALDESTLAANSVINIILPSNRVTLDICEAFLRTITYTAVESLQLNCVTKEQLLDAQKHPEDHPDLIVRVCGFSAKFTSLSPEWQQEVLTRNFYE
ncbi:MAG: pyruvate formate lyase family protein [Eubacteriales bacterium]|nr:pyruvate formate lyase family protein [Eubacteriales bacterium]